MGGRLGLVGLPACKLVGWYFNSLSCCSAEGWGGLDLGSIVLTVALKKLADSFTKFIEKIKLKALGNRFTVCTFESFFVSLCDYSGLIVINELTQLLVSAMRTSR